MSCTPVQSDCRPSGHDGARIASPRTLDRWDGLILATAVTAGILATGVMLALDPLAPVPQPPSVQPLIGMPPAPAVSQPPLLLPQPPSSSATSSSVPPSQSTLLVPQTPSAHVPQSPSPSVPQPPTPSWLPGDDLPLVAADPSLVAQAIGLSSPVLMALTVAFPILRLRRPCPPRRDLARQPGMAACGIAILVLVVQLSAVALAWALAWTWTMIGPPPSPNGWAFGPPTPASPLYHLWISIRGGFFDSAWSGQGMAGAWLLMALGGWWRPERSAIDRLGRALGAAWIAIMVAGLIESFRLYL